MTIKFQLDKGDIMGCLGAIFYFLVTWFMSFIIFAGIGGMIFGEQAMDSPIVTVLSLIGGIFLFLVVLAGEENKHRR